MRLIKKELDKLIKHPMMWGMTIVFLTLNFLILYPYIGGGHVRLHFHKLHDAVLGYGLDLDHPNPEFDAEDEYGKFYLNYVDSQGNLYDKLDMLSILEHKQDFYNYHPTGAYAQFLRHNYEKLQQRVETIRATGEGRYGFYPGSAGPVHTFLYIDGMRNILWEAAILMMLSVLYLMDYERIHKTRDIVLTSRTGKALMARKITVGIGTGLFFSALLTAGTLGMFFHQIPFRGLWNVPVSTAMMAEARIYGFYPFITFRPLTVGSYLILSLVAAALLLTEVGCLTAAACLLLQNSYFTFLLKVLFYLTLFQTTYTYFCNFWDILICLNPVALWMTTGMWFMEHEMVFSFEGSEFLCLALWAAISAAGLMAGRARYLRMELK